MSTLLQATVFSVFSCAATCAVTCAFAAETPAAQNPETDNVVTITSPKYRVAPDEFMYLGGTYALDNGAVLKFSRLGLSRFMVSLTGMPDTEVHALSENRFVAKDKSINMVFAPHGSGYDTRITVQYRPANAVAQQGEAEPKYIVAANY
ncbi:hypothetical protein [Undibacterium flavidum]|uniref:Uncharacterized protein n=1 Tax=Undibacterium flavidum TaxID=2762297 RepID=A0ABR6YH34_9BURK|nr:hypothetical protein [Undibacterium flavidum]MBC3875822.1 hypothetical protein [Undibacterium flavidum]